MIGQIQRYVRMICTVWFCCTATKQIGLRWMLSLHMKCILKMGCEQISSKETILASVVMTRSDVFLALKGTPNNPRWETYLHSLLDVHTGACIIMVHRGSGPLICNPPCKQNKCNVP